MPSEYAKSLGARLRSIRQQQGLSLQGVEEKSAGRWKAVVVGSYERGDRAVTVSRLAELAEFYRVPVAELLPEGGGVRVRRLPLGPRRAPHRTRRAGHRPAEPVQLVSLPRNGRAARSTTARSVCLWGQRVAYSAIRPSTPLRYRGESSVDSDLASSTASVMATGSSMSSQ